MPTVWACYEVARKERRRSMVELHVTPDPRSATGKDISSDVVDRDWLGRELGRFDLDRRAVLVIHSYPDLPVSEVAENLDIPYGTGAVRIENEDGGWAGDFHAFKVADDVGPEWYHLTGEGVYEGVISPVSRPTTRRPS